jgi:hypothetical protein
LPVFGGAYTPDNRMVFPIREHFGGWGSIHRQIADLPDGSHVIIKPVGRIGYPAVVSRRPPHHPAYGSVPSGSGLCFPSHRATRHRSCLCLMLCYWIDALRTFIFWFTRMSSVKAAQATTGCCALRSCLTTHLLA